MRVEGIHTMGYWPVPRRGRLRLCCHNLSAMQPSACLTLQLPWTRALFTVLGRRPLCDKGVYGWILERDTISESLLTFYKYHVYRYHYSMVLQFLKNLGRLKDIDTMLN
jgi:hypothetical protein